MGSTTDVSNGIIKLIYILLFNVEGIKIGLDIGIAPIYLRTFIVYQMLNIGLNGIDFDSYDQTQTKSKLEKFYENRFRYFRHSSSFKHAIYNNDIRYKIYLQPGIPLPNSVEMSSHADIALKIHQ